MKKILCLVFLIFFYGCRNQGPIISLPPENAVNGEPKIANQNSEIMSGENFGTLEILEQNATESNSLNIGESEVKQVVGESNVTEDDKVNISVYIEKWGNPKSIVSDPFGGKVYNWSSCKKTGNYIERCNGNECSNEPEINCCTKSFATDPQGFITKYQASSPDC